MSTDILRVDDLSVGIDNRIVVRNASFSVNKGDISLIIGPNGSGKTSLIQAILGNPRYKILSGRIIYEGRDITDLDMVSRVNMGISAAFQFPPKLKGVTLSKLANEILKRRKVANPEKVVYRLAAQLNLIEMLDRELNVGFSGGEMRRAELFLTLLQRPKLALLDEIDSGVDVENVALMARVLNKYINNYKMSILLVTHSASIAKYLKFNRTYVVVDGIVREAGSPEEILEKVREYGFYDFVSGIG